jgi:ribosomal protein L7/L12
MQTPDPMQVWLLVAAVGIICFLLGRGTARNRDIDRTERKMRDAEAAQMSFGALPAENQSDIDRLVTEGKMIEAVKLVREWSGLGLKESKDVVDARRKALKP